MTTSYLKLYLFSMSRIKLGRTIPVKNKGLSFKEIMLNTLDKTMLQFWDCVPVCFSFGRFLEPSVYMLILSCFTQGKVCQLVCSVMPYPAQSTQQELPHVVVRQAENKERYATAEETITIHPTFWFN